MYLDTLTPAAQTAIKNAFTIVTQSGASLEGLIQQASNQYGGEVSSHVEQATAAIRRGKNALDNAHRILTSDNGAGATATSYPTSSQPDQLAALLEKMDEVLDRL